MREALFALAGLGVLAGITALVLGWHREPPGEAWLQSELKDASKLDRKECYLDDPMYEALGHVSTDWLKERRGFRGRE